MDEIRYSSWMLERVAIGDTVRLRLAISTIGRHSSCVIRILDSAYVSRHHAEIEVSDDDQKVYLRDTKSINGIFINDQQYSNEKIELHNNDLIGIGVTTDSWEAADDILKLPIFRLKYAPLRQIRQTSIIKQLLIPVTPPQSPLANDEPKANDCNKKDKDEKPCCSKLAFNNEIFVISDDEDAECKVLQKSQSKQLEPLPKQSESQTSNNESPELFSNLKNQIEVVVTDKCTVNEKITSSENNQQKKENELDLKCVIDKEPVIEHHSFINPSQMPLTDETVVQNEKSAENLLKNKNEREPILHVPIISDVKKERIRSVSANIQNIFGDIEGDDVIQEKIKEINPSIYNEMCISKQIKPLEGDEKALNNGDFIILTDDEDGEVEELGTLISNIAETKKEKLMDEAKSSNIDTKSDNVEKFNPSDDVDLDEYTKYAPNSDDEDIEDLMFSQVLINDMKAELQDELHDEEHLHLPNKNSDNISSKFTEESVKIKQEPGSEVFSLIPKELENSSWIISDNEDYDEELETKVNDWSSKIFSQSFNQMNMSQVYDLNETDNNDVDEDDDDDNENNLSILEDDLDSIADFYNNNDEKKADININECDKQLKNFNDEMKIALDKHLETTETKAEEKVIGENENKNEKNLVNVDIDMLRVNVDNINNQKLSGTVQKKSLGNHKNEKKLPVVRLRRITKSTKMSSLPANELDQDKVPSNKLLKCSDKSKPESDKIITTTRLPPPTIDAPSLPKHRDKPRDVSTEKKSSSLHKTVSSIIEKDRQEKYNNDMKRKWFEKPSLSKKHDKEQRELIKKCRKHKLKELAERKNNPSKENTKRKLSREDYEHKAKIPKVKITTHNRGAFLATTDLTAPVPPQNASKQEYINQFKIPKVIKQLDKPKMSDCKDTTKKDNLARSLSVDDFETFSQQISKPDILLLKETNSTNRDKFKNLPACAKINTLQPLRRHSITDPVKQPFSKHTSNSTDKISSTASFNTICKDAIAARAVRTTNKITFASMEKNIVENEENKRKLSMLNANNQSSLKQSNCTLPRTLKNKTVRFNDTPIVYYIERVIGACKKINNKDVMPMTTYRDRREMIRRMYPSLDYTDTIISHILCWSNEWLIRRNAEADAASDVIYPMRNYFDSFEQYKSIMFPLMRLEFLSLLEREYNATRKMKKFKVSLEYASQNKDRIMLVTKFNTQNKELTENNLYDLVLLEHEPGTPQIFAFAISNRKGAGSFNTIIYEILAKNVIIEYFNAIKELNVRPVMDKTRVHFGAFNSVYQLQSTPLFQKIINPLELMKCKSPQKKKVMYRGFDPLNDNQRQVLLNTYMKIVDETTSNITLIQGPPGTGKSRVITNLVLQSLYGEEVRYLDKKILICAQSNAAVDVIAGKLYKISMRMRPEKRFRLIRYGLLNKMHPSVMPVALQKVVEYDQLKKLQAKNKNIQFENKENLKNQILQFEAQISEMSKRNIKGTVDEDLLLEKQRQLQLMKNILNQNMRPEDERSLFTFYLSNANIVCATLSSCANLMQYTNFFDICIIDEATQCTEPWTLSPLKFGINSLVLVGDTQQLPATVISKKAHQLGLRTSLFTRIQNCLDNTPCTSVKGTNASNNVICSLQTQYRMHPEICKWPNQYFYRNELINAKLTTDLNKSPLVPFSILSLSYTQNNDGVDGKITNNLEAKFVAKLLKALDGFIPNKYNSYGVITPYAHHRVTLESSIRSLGLTNIMVNTIDSYQGLEKDVIVISNARTSGIGFLSNPQRLNVALTRSKKCLILCGNFKNLETVPAWRCLLENARERGLYHEISENCIEDMQTNVIEKIKLKNHK